MGGNWGWVRAVAHKRKINKNTHKIIRKVLETDIGFWCVCI